MMNSIISRIVKLCIFSVMLIVLSGCTVKIAYHYLDFLIKWEVGKYVELDKNQKQYLTETLEAFHDWHRETQLPKYANFIEDTKTLLEKGDISAEELHALSDEAQLLMDESAEYLIPHTVHIFSTLSDKQIAKLKKKLEKDQAKYNKDYVLAKREKVVKKHIKDIRKYTSPFFGKFTKGQKFRLNRWGGELEFYESYSLEQQKISGDLLLEALASKDDQTKLEETVRKLLFYRSDEWIEPYREATDFNQKISFEMLADLYNSQTQKQRKKTFNKLDSYQKDFVSLHNKKKDRG